MHCHLQPCESQALEALETVEGSMAATRMVASLMPVMEWFLAANVSAVVPDTRHVVPEHVVLQALMAGNGNMPLCLQGDGSDETLNVARGYNATNAGWGVLHWGVASGRGKWAALSPSCWALALQGQSQTSAESLANLAITGPASVERKRVHLSTHSQALVAPPLSADAFPFYWEVGSSHPYIESLKKQ